MRLVLVLLAALTLAACANHPPPVTSLAGTGCAQAPALSAARELSFGAVQNLDLRFDGNSPCLTTPVGAAIYGTVRLPRLEAPYLVSVASLPQGPTLFAPRVSILGEEGQTVRQVTRDSFNYRGAALEATLRVSPTDRYLLISSDPEVVGRDVSKVVSSMRSTVVCTPLCIAVYSGSDQNTVATLAHNGAVNLSARAFPTAR